MGDEDVEKDGRERERKGERKEGRELESEREREEQKRDATPMLPLLVQTA